MGLLDDSQRVVSDPYWALTLATWLVQLGWQIREVSPQPLHTSVPLCSSGYLSAGWSTQVPNVTASRACFLFQAQSRRPLVLGYFLFCFIFFVFVFGHATWLVGSQFPSQRLNLGHGSESLES